MRDNESMTRKTSFTPTGSSLDETAQSAITTLDSANDTIDSLRKNATSQLTGGSASYSDKFLRTFFPQLATSMATTAVGMAWKKSMDTDTVPSATDPESRMRDVLVVAVVSAVAGSLLARAARKLADKLILRRMAKRQKQSR